MGRLIICLVLAAGYGAALMPLLPYKVGRDALLAAWAVPGFCLAALGVVRTGYPGARSVDRYVISAIGLSVAQLVLAYGNEFVPGSGNAGPLGNGPFDFFQIVIAGVSLAPPVLTLLARVAFRSRDHVPEKK